jgi:putative transposase
LDSRDLALRDAIEAIALDFTGHGYRRVTKELPRDGWVVNHKRVPQVICQESLLGQEAPLRGDHRRGPPLSTLFKSR